MNAKLNLRRSPILATIAIICVVLLGTSDSAFAQIDGPVQGGGNQQPVFDGGDNGDADPTATTGGDGETGDGQIDTVEPTRLLYDIPDRRNQGFVGATGAVIGDQGFVGPTTEEPDAEVAEGRFIGGEVNQGIGNRTATTSSRELQENGFSIQRKSIRTKLRPAFATPSVPSYVAERRFQSRMTRQPVVREFGQGVTVTIANRAAVLTGFVRSNVEREIIKRQLHLEPGVYRIDDRTSIAQ